MAHRRNTPPNPRTAKATLTLRNLLAQGFTDEAMLINAAAEALGGDDAQKIARKVWDKQFRSTEPN